MTASAPLLDLLWPLLVFGIPMAVFTGIARASWPARERTPINRWAWTDLHADLRQGLRLSSQHSPLSRLMEAAPAPTTRNQAPPPRPEPR